MKGKYTIYPLNLGTITRQKGNMAYQKEPGKTMDFPLIAWYLTDGHTKVMIDTGGVSPDGRRYLPYTQSPDQTMTAALDRLGVEPGEIEHVVMTHLHWDHMGNNGLFANATFYAQKAELQYAVAPLAIHKVGYDLKQLFQTDYVVLVGDRRDLLPGISVILTPGHSPGCQSVAVDTEAGEYIVTGDFIALYECYSAEPMIANGMHTDLVVYYESMAKIKKLGTMILPGHDPKVFEQHQYPPR